MNNWDNRYAERVKLLVEILPTLAKEHRFALKGGTAINLFEHDLPRLSVDIDLTWLPVGDFASDVRDISAALEAMVRDVAARLNAEERIAAYVVEAENFESIHNHSAYALVERDKEADESSAAE